MPTRPAEAFRGPSAPRRLCGLSSDRSPAPVVSAWHPRHRRTSAGHPPANPTGTSGTSYIIRRKLPSESEFSFIGVSGKKEFVDDSLIAGPDSVQYTVQGQPLTRDATSSHVDAQRPSRVKGQRADSSGPLSPVFTVNFGQAPGGGFTATVHAGA